MFGRSARSRLARGSLLAARLANEIGGLSKESEQMDVDAPDSREVRSCVFTFLATVHNTR